MGECGPTATCDDVAPRGRRVIADGGMRANCNRKPNPTINPKVIADGGMRANCNPEDLIPETIEL